ncbi:hypothetical protein [Komagataeibacter xylinus]|uniref:hypothetical protein n=1 Tax=Komagataeibacter xylinus TaxID=28448 RepID=UPI0012E85012|nr:hypothetical protein [Komagataeibacter xylinus]
MNKLIRESNEMPDRSHAAPMKRDGAVPVTCVPFLQCLYSVRVPANIWKYPFPETRSHHADARKQGRVDE